MISPALAESLAEGMFFAGLRGFAGLPPPLRAPRAPAPGGGAPPQAGAQNPAKGRKPRTLGIEGAPILAMVIVSMPPSPGPPTCALVEGVW
jgi:hypothetical protein